MADVTININGRNYSISCDDGQERRVMELGSFIDKRLREIARGAGAVSEQHLMVLTSLLMADELFDVRDENKALQDGGAILAANDTETEERSAHMADIINSLARKIETVASQLEKAQA